MPDIANGISTAVFTGYPVWCDVEDRSGGGTAVGSVDMQECGPSRLEAQVARLRLRLKAAQGEHSKPLAFLFFVGLLTLNSTFGGLTS